MSLSLKTFQKRAIKQLLDGMEDSKIKEIVLKSPTGSGKTIILTYFMDEYLRGHPKSVFVWLTPGKGNLEEQSKNKMDLYIHDGHTKLLADVMISGFEDGDSCFINWEKLTKKDNTALRDSERTNFSEWILKAQREGLSFNIIIDESHNNFTEKSDAVIQLFNTKKIIRCSATPKKNELALWIEISESDVIADGLIKKRILINENFPRSIKVDSPTHFLLDKALDKQNEICVEYAKRKTNVNPLIIIQIPNNSETLLLDVQKYLETKNITVESGLLSIWLSDDHRNLDNISVNDSIQKAIVIKQAVATGWDCPRAHILVKLRENMDEVFEIQTVGRIRRMPEVKHYSCDTLDDCYIFTFDNKFITDVKSGMGNVFEAKTIFLKKEYSDFEIESEKRTMVTDLRDPRLVIDSIQKYCKLKYNTTTDYRSNKTKMEAHGLIFSDSIVNATYSGILDVEKISIKEKSPIKTEWPLNTHIHGRYEQQCIGRIGLEVGLDHQRINTVVRKLFCKEPRYNGKILDLDVRHLYAFIINNVDSLRHLFRESMSIQLQQALLPEHDVSLKKFKFPPSETLMYDAQSIQQSESKKNVYSGYLMSAEKRSRPEKKFEKYLESSMSVEWFYKNGNKGNEYFSIVYYDNSGFQNLFYPDYILKARDQIWIVEVKGDFDSSGGTQNLDIYAEKKFEALRAYADTHGIKSGFVRYDEHSEELCISTDQYSENIDKNNWKLLSDCF